MLKSVVVSAMICCLVAVPCLADRESDNKNIVTKMIEAVNDRDFDALDDLVAENVVRHCAATPDVNVTSLEEFKAFILSDLRVCPDAFQAVEIMLADGDKVAVLVTYSGTQTGDMGPFPASGKHLELPFMGILRIEDGKIAELWVEWDNLNALTQLGHFPPGDAGE